MRVALLIIVGFAFACTLADEIPKPNPAEAAPAPNTYEYRPSYDKNDCEACKKNLETISAAILAYRKDHKAVPNWLSDLVPTYLPDQETLTCPVTKRTGGLSPYGALDPNIRCSYLYQFHDTPIAKVNKGKFPRPMMTTREWKKQQMGLVGSEVPIVRCLMHDPVLNLSFGGKVYESPVNWEKNFLDVANAEDFSPH